VRILIVEDDPKLGSLLMRGIKEFFAADLCVSLEEALYLIETHHYDALILDRMLDGADRGLELIERFQVAFPSAGVVIISAKGEVDERIEGLSRGADDYLSKPLNLRELIARLHALMRRRQPRFLSGCDGLIRLDLVERALYNRDEMIALTRKEHALIFALARKVGQVVTQEELLDLIYEDPGRTSSNNIVSLVRSLRRKLPEGVIQTIKTRGYRLALTEEK
jgi:DNA-binding response OmpR family regulator